MDAPAPTSHARDLWAPRRQLSLEKARRRSAQVQVLRNLFVGAAAICFGTLAGHLVVNAVESSSRGKTKISSDQIVTMISPRFTGRDSSGNPFVLTARTAQRLKDNPDMVRLYKPTLTDEFGSEVSAPSGLYDQTTQTLELYEDVQVADSGGYLFKTVKALIRMEEGKVEGGVPLVGSGPLGDMRADTYEITDQGGRLVLTGNVQMTLYPGEPDGKPVEGEEQR